MGDGGTHLLQLELEGRDHGLFDDDALLVKVLDDVVVVHAVDVDDDGLDRRVALDEHAWDGYGQPMWRGTV